MGIDGDLSFATYQPNLEPVLKANDVSGTDIERAADRQMGQIESLVRNQSDDAKDVICPHCSQTFSI